MSTEIDFNEDDFNESHDFIKTHFKDVNSKITTEDFDNASTFESIGTDSLAMMELIMEVEEQFDVEISDDIVERLKTPNDLINFLKE